MKSKAAAEQRKVIADDRNCKALATIPNRNLKTTLWNFRYAPSNLHIFFSKAVEKTENAVLNILTPSETKLLLFYQQYLSEA